MAQTLRDAHALCIIHHFWVWHVTETQSAQTWTTGTSAVCVVTLLLGWFTWESAYIIQEWQYGTWHASRSLPVLSEPIAAAEERNTNDWKTETHQSFKTRWHLLFCVCVWSPIGPKYSYFYTLMLFQTCMNSYDS